MKYCPYCGADLPDGAVAFCTECGKSLPAEKEKIESDSKKNHLSKQKPKNAKKQRKKSKSIHAQPAKDNRIEDEDYDGYYNDVLPIDEGCQRDGLDPTVIRKIAVLIGGLVIVIGMCIALMYLL